MCSCPIIIQDSNQGKIACKATAVGWCGETCQSHLGIVRLTRGEFDWFLDGVATLKVIQNE